MSIFRRAKKFTVSEKDPTYKVKYLGNVQTAMMKGTGCVDKPTGILWNNYLKSNNPGLDMKLSICSSGLKALTKEQGLTEYRAHRVSYCIAHPDYPRLFVWVYRHEGKKMKVELRCHAVLCKTDAKAKAMAVQLHDKLAFALSEFMREKTRRQNARLALQRTNSLPSNNSGIAGAPMRKKFLSTGQNYKPSAADRSPAASKLGSITETLEEEEEVVEEDEDEIEAGLDEIEDTSQEMEEGDTMVIDSQVDPFPNVTIASTSDLSLLGESSGEGDDNFGPVDAITDRVFGIEIGNDIEAFKQDQKVQYQLATERDSDEDSSESGYSDQQDKDSLSLGSSEGTRHNGVLHGEGKHPCHAQGGCSTGDKLALRTTLSDPVLLKKSAEASSTNVNSSNSRDRNYNVSSNGRPP